MMQILCVAQRNDGVKKKKKEEKESNFVRKPRNETQRNATLLSSFPFVSPRRTVRLRQGTWRGKVANHRGTRGRDRADIGNNFEAFMSSRRNHK